MTDMVEAMARSGRDAYGKHLGKEWVDWAKADPKKRAEWEAVMQAGLSVVLDRLRSPDEAVLQDVADNTGPVGCCANNPETIREVLDAIADHIAKDAGI